MAAEATSPLLESSRRRSPIRLIAVLLLAAVCIGLAAAGVLRQRSGPAAAASSAAAESGHAGTEGPGETAAPAEAAEVKVEVVRAAAVAQPVRVTGNLRTDETVVLSTKATGLVKRVTAREGERVRRGQLLVELESGDLRAQRERAVASVGAAEAKLQQAQTSRDIKNAAARSDYRRAEQALAAARVRLEQSKSLAGIAGTESDTRVASAASLLQSARERLKVLQEGSRRQEKAAAEASVARAQAQVARMKSMLDRREQLLRDGAIASEVVDNARRDYEVALTDLDAAKQQLSLVQEGPRTEEVRVAEEAVRQAEAALKDAEANRARRQVSNQDVETAATQVQQAEAALDAAKAALAQSRWNEDEIRNARAALMQARADVRLQDELIRQTLVYSPVNGVITKLQAHVGESVVQMRNELMTLVSSDTLYFEATAPETNLPQLRAGQPAQVILDAIPGAIFPGVLREIIPVAEGTNRSVRLRISLPKTIRTQAVVGGFARAQIQGGARSALSVPRAAIVSDEGQLAVFVVEGEKAVRRAVRVGDAGGVGDRVQVLEGLRGGERVVVEGAQGLVDGQEVRAGS